MMGDHGNPQKKRSIDEIIEHMTADIQPSDGQYIPLGFTPPPTPANAPRGWSEYAISPANSSVDNQPYTSNPPMTNARENPVFLPDVSGVHYEFNAAHLPKQIEVPGHHDFYFAGATLQQQQLNVMTENREIIGTVVDNGGNIVNVVYSGSNVLSPQYHMMTHDSREPMKLPLGGFIPYQSNSIDNITNPLRDYGLFNSSDAHHQPQQNRQQAQPFHGVMNNRVQLIENLVGNWVPNQSGTYSPFGCMDNGVRQIPSTNQQGIQTVPISTESDVECNRGVGRGVRKARIIAEVRPMRPTYSDVLSKSAPTTVQAVKPNYINVNSANKPESLNIIKSKTNTSKNNGANKKNNKSSTLKRQHSSGSDEHNYNGIINCGKLIQNAVSSQKSVSIDIKDNNSGIGFNSMPRKWVSLDDLDSDKQMSGELDNEIFQSEGLISKTLRQRNEGNNRKLGMSSSKSKYGQQDDFLGTTLNNHKPPAYAAGGKCPGGLGGGGTKRPPIHINNNLGTSTWSSSGTGGGAGACGGSGGGGGGSSGGGSNGGTGEKNILKGSSGAKNSRNCQEDKKGSKSDAKIGTTGTNSTKSSLTRSSSVSSSHSVGVSEKPTLGKRRGKRKECQSPLALICRPFKRHVTHWGQLALQIVFWFIHLLSDVLSMSVRLLIHLCVFVYDWLCTWSVHAWISLSSAVLQLRLLERLGFHGRWWNFGRNNGKYSGNGQSSSGSGVGGNFKDGFPPGLENNISLPSTGEEAMRRLLACKGKDPYSILGVTPHCTDEDIKKYYKRQAVLVHPDKNNQPGAEEAFKILVHAFELIGEPERRTAYDRRVAETQQVEQAWSELSDLLSQLHKKMEYAANTIRCTNCGKRHRRIHVDRPCYAARFCSQCKIHHNAREGDIWAESSMFGFLWHYYACMDGGVYDITEWAACQAENLRHLRANTHIVQYRIVLGKQSQQQSHSRHHNSRTNQRSGPDSNSEPDLEDFLNNLYNQSGGNGVGEGGRSDQGRNRKKGKRKK